MDARILQDRSIFSIQATERPRPTPGAKPEVAVLKREESVPVLTFALDDATISGTSLKSMSLRHTTGRYQFVGDHVAESEFFVILLGEFLSRLNSGGDQ